MLKPTDLGLKSIHPCESATWDYESDIGSGDVSKCLPGWIKTFCEKHVDGKGYELKPSHVNAIAHTLIAARVRNARLAKERDEYRDKFNKTIEIVGSGALNPITNTKCVCDLVSEYAESMVPFDGRSTNFGDKIREELALDEALASAVAQELTALDSLCPLCNEYLDPEEADVSRGVHERCMKRIQRGMGIAKAEAEGILRPKKPTGKRMIPWSERKRRRQEAAK